MLLLAKLFFLIGLVRAATLYDPLQERPLLMAVLYAVGDGVLDSFDPVTWQVWLGRTVAGFLLAWLYFWLLSRMEDAGVLWWVVCLMGVPMLLL